ncbi:MAG: DUF547 domain-containing protein [Gammaproteobacteria bacterium]|nr:DUF547 domain-containing protein [Gammaproteobacteria bacterium]
MAAYVDTQGRVDFRALAKDSSDLDQYIAFIAEHSPMATPQLFPDEHTRLAHYLNSYNALSMKAILDEGIPESLGGLKKFWFFGIKDHAIGNQEMTLYSYENDIIRKLGEPRVHFALNCMSVGCPRLPQVPFDAATLATQLEAETRKFLNEERNVRVDDSRRLVWLTEIFDFFPEDFLAESPSLIAYVNRYRARPIPADYKVKFIDYDWTVNGQPR